MTAPHTQGAVIPEASARPGNDPIFALHGEATARAAAGESIVNATLGALLHDDGTLALMPVASEVMVAVPAVGAAAYAPISGDPAFRAALLEDLFGESAGAPQGAGNSLVEWSVAVATPGATGALHHAFLNFLEQGQAALTTQYFWGPYAAMAAHSHRRLDTFAMFADDGGFHTAAFAEALDRHIDEQGRALLLFNFPCHNPTGFSLNAAEWQGVAEVVAAAGQRAPVALLIDYAYGRYGNAESAGWLPAVPIMAESATVLVAWTASKSYTQYGARVGALVAVHRDDDERTRIGNALNYSCRATWSNCNHRGLLAVTRLLAEPDLRSRADAERADLVALLDSRVARFKAEADRVGVPYPRYEGGFFVSVFADDPEQTAATMRDVCVYVVPIQGAVRVGLCAIPESAIPRLVKALAVGLGLATE